MKKLLFFISFTFYCLNFSTAIAEISGPLLVLNDTTHDFGSVRNGATTRWFLEIKNMGDEVLIIDTAYLLNNSQFYADNSTSFPIAITPSDTLLMGIWFQPNADEEFISVMKLITNDPAHEVVEINLEGSGYSDIWAMGEEFWSFSADSGNSNSIRSIISTGDISGDEIQDLVLASGNENMYCLNGNSNETADILWQHEIPGGELDNQTCLSLIADIDYDAYPDIVAGTCGTDRSILALSGKTGKQIWKLETTNYGNGGCIFQINVSYDYNGDGVPDVLAATGDDESGNGPKRVYCVNVMTGNPIWERPLGGPVYAVIGTDDFTGDGQPDVVAGMSNTEETEGSAKAINGATGLMMWNTVMPGKSVKALAQVDDSENSGHKNIAIGDYSGEYRIMDPYTLYFTSVGGIGTYLIQSFSLLDDINNDGNDDLLVASDASKAIVLDGDSGPFLLYLALAGKSISTARIADVSGDGINDILVGTSDDHFVYCINAAHTSILFQEDFKTAVTAIRAIADINGDGSMEMVAGGENGKIVCYSGGTDALVGLPSTHPHVSNNLAYGCFPNPFTFKTTLFFELEKAGQISIKIFDNTGRIILHLADESFSKGRHEITWPATESINQENGVYYYNITGTEFVVTGKMIRIK